MQQDQLLQDLMVEQVEQENQILLQIHQFHMPVVAVVDDIAKSTSVNVEKMKGEHFKDPTHFGIHISQLETLNPDKVKENGPVDKSIIADMFD